MANYTAGTAYLAIRPSMTGFHPQLRNELRTLNPEPVLNIRVMPQWTAASATELRRVVRDSGVTLDISVKPVWTSASEAALRAALRSVIPPPQMDVVINPVWRGGALPPLPDQNVNVRANVDRASFANAINSFAGLARSISLISAGAGLLAIAPILGAIAGAAVASAGALALIPAVAAAAGLAIGALKVGMSGFSDVLKETDPAKYAEGLAKLSPNARAAAVEIRSLAPAWDALRLDVQDALFRNVGVTINEIAGRYLPLLRGGLVGAADAFSYATGGVRGFFESSKTFADIGTIFSNSNASIKIMSGSLDAVLRILRDVSVVGSEFLPGLATGWANAAQRASEYVSRARETGELRAFIVSGMEALSQLGQLFSNVGGIIGTVWRAAGESGNSLMTTIVTTTGAARDFLNTANGYGALVAIFTTLRGVVDALIPGLLVFANSIATGIQILGPALQPIASAFSAILAAVSPLIPVAAQIAAVLGTALAGALSAVAPLVSSVAGVVGGVLLAALRAVEPVFPILTDTVNRLVPPLTAVAQVIGGALVSAINIVAPSLPPLAQAMGNLWVALTPLIDAVVRLAAEMFTALAPAIPPIVAGVTRLVNEAIVPLIPPLTRIVEALIPGMTQTINFLVPVVSFLADVLVTALVWAVNTLVIPALTALADFIEFMNGRWQAASDLVALVWNNIGTWISDAWNGTILPIFNAVVGFLGSILGPAFDILWTVVRIAIGAIGAIIFVTWDTIIRPAWEALVAFVNGVIIPLMNFLWRNVIEPVWNGISAAINVAWVFIRDNIFVPITTFINDVINPAMTGARDTATSAWEGLRAGIDVAWTAIRTAVFDPLFGWLTKTIPDAFATGTRIAGELWNGIKKTMRDPVQAVIDVVYNGGIVRAWNTIADFVGLKDQKLAEFRLPAYAKGGPVMNEQVARIGEAGPEYVMSAPAVQNLGGIGAVDALHRAASARKTLVQLNKGRIVEGADHDGPGYSTVGFGGVRPWVAKAGHELRRRFGIGVVGGIGQRANASDHPKGLALDFMTSGENGTRLANHVISHKGHYGVTYAIWRQQINNGSGWRRMEDRGSPTANHFDHVHVSFTGAGPGGGGGNIGGFDGSAGGGVAFDPIGWVMGLLPDLGGLLGKVGGAGPMIDIVKGFGSKVFNAIKDFAIAKATAWGGGIANAVGGAVGAIQGAQAVARWSPQALGALADAGESPLLLPTLLRRMSQESGGNPAAVNNWDSNAKRGTPSVGLMQVIGPTFQAYAGPHRNKQPQMHGVSIDPHANIYASLRYAKARYGDVARGYNRPGGYDRGGLARGAGWLSKGPMPERILDSRQTRAFEAMMSDRSGVQFGTRLIVDRGGEVAGGDGAAAGGGGPFIGTLIVPTPEGAGVNETLDAVMTRARHEQRTGGGRYSRP